MSPELKSSTINRAEITADDEAFYKVFPKEKLEKIESLGDKLLSPFEIMAKFDAIFSRNKLKRSYVLARLSQTDYGNKIYFVEKNGKTKVFAKNAESLMRALHSVYLQPDIIDCFPDNLKAKLQNVSNPPVSVVFKKIS